MNKIITLVTALTISLISFSQSKHSVFLEAESFENKGGWVVDQQFMDLMGSSYLIAHGMGVPVADAKTTVDFPSTGEYNVFVRTFNWTSPWHNGEGPGKFQLMVNGKKAGTVLGASGSEWFWQNAGKVNITNAKTIVGLHDLTGFNGRVDAIYFTKGNTPPPNELKALEKFRKNQPGIPKKPVKAGKFDLVVVGGGVAGTAAAISAARLGLQVALIQDRPVLGGNNSSEVRVHLGGRINVEPFPALGDVVKEIGPSRGGNAQPAEYYEDEKKMEMVLAEENISLFNNYRAFGVKTKGSRITEVHARHIETSEELTFTAPLFADCTGDGTIGFLAGADYAMGREGRDEFGEPTAPEVADKMTMGSSVQWYSVEENKPVSFPVFQYGVDFNEKNSEKVTMGEWTWETGMNLNQIYDFERICFYSRNVDNLFMAGRNISVTHVALGTVRVMRTTGMMGEVVGMAASVAAKNKTNPRGVYKNHLDELKALMDKGVGKYDAENMQKYNEGSTLGPK